MAGGAVGPTVLLVRRPAVVPSARHPRETGIPSDAETDVLAADVLLYPRQPVAAASHHQGHPPLSNVGVGSNWSPCSSRSEPAVSASHESRTEVASSRQNFSTMVVCIICRIKCLHRGIAYIIGLRVRIPSMILTMLASDRSTVTPLSPPPHQGQQRTRHHPPANSNSCSTG